MTKRKHAERSARPVNVAAKALRERQFRSRVEPSPKAYDRRREKALARRAERRPDEAD